VTHDDAFQAEPGPGEQGQPPAGPDGPSAAPDRLLRRLDLWLLAGLLGGLLVSSTGSCALVISVLGMLAWLAVLSVALALWDLGHKGKPPVSPSWPAAGPPPLGTHLASVVAGLVFMALTVAQLLAAGVTALWIFVCFACLESGEWGPGMTPLDLPHAALWPWYPPLGGLLGLALWWVSGPGSGWNRAR